MTDRERFIARITGQPVDRPPYWLFWGPWGTTVERWRQEIGGDPIPSFREDFEPDAPPRPLPVDVGPCPAPEHRVLEETAEYVVHTDRWGIVRKDFKHTESMSEFLEFPVKSRADWERFRDERLDPAHPDRLAGPWREVAAECAERGQPVQLGGFPDTTFYGGVRWLLGDEDCLLAFCSDPALVNDILDHLLELYLTVFEPVLSEARVDVLHIWEDMCGRNGPLISPDMWREFLGPRYREMTALAGARGVPVVSVDTDGDPEAIIPPMMEAGVNMLFPVEVAAGCDINAHVERYPEMGFMGGIDKRALAQGPAAIDAELERVRPAIQRGRYIADLDHLIPDDVSWRNWRYYAQALKELVCGT